ncbi:hypothetical protein [Amycolatopsis silviterrae]|uniref:VIT family protein n=1 Tax=Amycolatopsis silviterrae TaxID=1656914 RepID=A0ABW5HNC5_9PSEU
MLHGRGLDVWLAVRVGIVSLVTAVFTVFVAEYAQLRAEHELNLTASGRLAAGSLGRKVAWEAVEAAVVASLSSFVGAVAPLQVGVLLRGYSWAALVVAIAALGALGASLATVVGGRRPRWMLVLMACGGAVAVVGLLLGIA